MWKPLFALVAATLAACGGSNGTHATTPLSDMGTGTGGGGNIVGEHGQVVDYFSLKPLAGMTVTDGSNTTTTDASGNFVLPAPMGVELAPVVTGPGYSVLQLAHAQAAGADVDLGPIVYPNQQTLADEQQLIHADTMKGILQVVIIPTGACTSVAGATLTVNAPANAAVAYFTPDALPVATHMNDRTMHRPSAVIYDLDPGTTSVDVSLAGTTCKLAAPGTPYNGATYDGIATIQATEPGDVNAAALLLAE